MKYCYKYKTPDGFSNIQMESDGEVLTGLRFEDSKYKTKLEERQLPIFQETSKWLNSYFRGENPGFTPKYIISSLTPFRQEVIEQMKQIPYGKAVTYQDIAKKIAQKRGMKKMSAQAVGGAVGWNPICIIIPCHRVVGANGNLTGYSGGINNKIALLELEKNDMSKFFVPKNKK